MGHFFLEFDAANNVLRVSYVGQVTDEILLGASYATRDFLLSRQQQCRRIHNFLEVTAFDVSTDAIKKLASLPTIFEQQPIVAIVAPTDHLYGLARMYTILTEDTRPHHEVVRSMEAAYALLGIASAEFSRVGSD